MDAKTRRLLKTIAETIRGPLDVADGDSYIALDKRAARRLVTRIDDALAASTRAKYAATAERNRRAPVRCVGCGETIDAFEILAYRERTGRTGIPAHCEGCAEAQATDERTLRHAR